MSFGSRSEKNSSHCPLEVTMIRCGDRRCRDAGRLQHILTPPLCISWVYGADLADQRSLSLPPDTQTHRGGYYRGTAPKPSYRPSRSPSTWVTGCTGFWLTASPTPHLDPSTSPTSCGCSNSYNKSLYLLMHSGWASLTDASSYCRHPQVTKRAWKWFSSTYIYVYIW